MISISGLINRSDDEALACKVPDANNQVLHPIYLANLRMSLLLKIDAENKELYLLGDINCNLLPEAITVNSSHLINIFDIYGLRPRPHEDDCKRKR